MVKNIIKCEDDHPNLKKKMNCEKADCFSPGNQHT